MCLLRCLTRDQMFVVADFLECCCALVRVTRGTYHHLRGRYRCLCMRGGADITDVDIGRLRCLRILADGVVPRSVVRDHLSSLRDPGVAPVLRHLRLSLPVGGIPA